MMGNVVHGLKMTENDYGKCTLKYLFLDGYSYIRFYLTECFHQKLGFIRRRGNLLWLVDSEVMLLAKLKKRIFNQT